MSRCLAITAVALIATFPCACDPPTDADPAEQTAAAGEPDPPPEQILRLVLRLTPDGVETVSAVEAPGRIGRRDPYREASTFYRALDRQGRLLCERGFRLETHLRSESQGPDGTIEGERVPIAKPVFTVVVPRHPDLDRILLFGAERGEPRHTAEPIGEVRP